MKCAECLMEYLAKIEPGSPIHVAQMNAWVEVRQSETTLNGTALCLEHLKAVIA